MKLSLKPLLVCASLALFPALSSVSAQEIAVLGPPTVSYEAQRTITTNEMSLIQEVHSKPGKNRSEMTMQGQQVIQIWRDDQKMLYSLSPQQGVAVAIPYGNDMAKSPLADFDEETAVLEKRFIGKETVNGMRTDHYFIKASSSGGAVTNGDFWTTPEKIAVRMRMKLTTPGEPEQDVSIDLIGLKSRINLMRCLKFQKAIRSCRWTACRPASSDRSPTIPVTLPTRQQKRPPAKQTSKSATRPIRKQANWFVKYSSGERRPCCPRRAQASGARYSAR
jgi:Domain of unknown function (DUF4412)